jgi:hypothetical protein
MSQSNKLAVLYYSVVDDRLQIETRGCFLLSDHISKVACTSAQWFSRYETANYAVAVLDNGTAVLLSIEDYQPAVVLWEQTIGRKVLAIKFIAHKEALIVLDNGKVLLFLVRNKKLIQRQAFQIEP